MNKIAKALFFGRDNRLSGLLAFMVIGAIVLGCTCERESSRTNYPDTNASNTAVPEQTPRRAPAPEKADASSGKVPEESQLQDLARTTIVDFNDAIQNEDFTNFHETISKPFQKEASPTRFKQVFQSFIDAGIDLSEVKDLYANFTTPASIDRSAGARTLKLKGNYATTPRRANFDLKYIPEGKEWKLIYIEINTKD